jgi:hypothetical protein
MSKLPKAMCVFCIPEASTGRLRRAVPKIPPKSSVLPRLPLNKSASLPTRSESTLPQLLIPLRFISCISNTYKKARRGARRPTPRFVNSSLAAFRSGARTRTAATSIPSMLYFTTSVHPGGGGMPFPVGQPFLAVTPRLARVTEHGPQVTTPQVPLRRNPQSARITDVSACSPPGNKSAPGGV